ncbi:CAZyme family GH76 [Penicillium chermesinum]|nr:CAZyme family GH76 [Penicillium chermesinum]
MRIDRIVAVLLQMLMAQHVSAIAFNTQDQRSREHHGILHDEILPRKRDWRMAGRVHLQLVEGAALCNALLNYWHFTGDDTYNDELSIALQWQGGSNGDYLPQNFSQYAGNDDQVQWASAAMTAAEYKLPDRPSGFSWLALAQGVYNNQKNNPSGWDPSTCGGGIRWQKQPFQSGYTLRNAISNGGFFQLAARLALYTGDASYTDWAIKSYNWSESHGLVNNVTWKVNDSTDGANGCTTRDYTDWTYNYGVFINGCAYMYEFTKDQIWLDRLNGLLNKSWELFFTARTNYAASDAVCEIKDNCDRNGMLFKGLMVMWLANVALLVPSTYSTILSKLQSSASGAASTCTGLGNNTCGVRWYGGEWDGKIGMEEDISATNVFSVAMLPFVNKDTAKPVSSSTGGDSKSDPNAGQGQDTGNVVLAPITTGDKAGAGILTVVFVGAVIGAIVFMFTGA